MKATQNNCRAKGQSAVDYSTVIKWIKKFCFGCKNLEDQAKLSSLKSVDSKAMLQNIATNLASSTQRVSGEPTVSV